METITAQSLRDFSRSLDPVLLAEDCGFAKLDPWQVKALRSTAQRMLLLCSRQAGKSTVAALLSLHTALYTSNALVLLVAPSQRQAGELFKAHVMRYYMNLLDAVPLVSSTQLTAEWANGSRIIALPGDETTVRSYSAVSLIVIDESAIVSDDLYYSLRPMLAVSGGRLICGSTPRGKRGFMYHEWVGGESWERHEAKASECERISKEFLDEERESMGEKVYAQEYCNQFNDASDSVFSYSEIEAAFADDTIEPLFSPGKYT
jgi:hypothetical protein